MMDPFREQETLPGRGSLQAAAHRMLELEQALFYVHLVKAKILVVGSSNTDMIISVDHLPKAGETILGGDFQTAAGGKGANQAVGAARAGGAVTFITRLGTDAFGDEALRGFVKEGMDVRRVARDRSAPSGVALIFVSARGENCIAVASGANYRITPGDVIAGFNALEEVDVLLVQLEIPPAAVMSAIAAAARRKIPVILNPAPARTLPDSLLRKVTILTPNETEAELLTGIRIKGLKAAKRAAQALLKRGVGTVVMTLGAQGVLVETGDESYHVAGFKVKAVDTTAAGDIFNGALAVAVAEKKSLRDAVRFGNAAAAISVTRKGAQPSVPTRKEIEAFQKEHRA